MRIHEDRFVPGDRVTWRNEEKATVTDGRKNFGNRLIIRKVAEVGQFKRDAGHTQYVWIEGAADHHPFSGAFFRHLAKWEN